MANHSPTKLVCGNTIIELGRGQLHTSELKLMERWGWSKKKVRAYLLLMKTLGMATSQGTSKGTTITLEKYGLYQACGAEGDIAQDTARDAQKA